MYLQTLCNHFYCWFSPNNLVLFKYNRFLVDVQTKLEENKLVYNCFGVKNIPKWYDYPVIIHENRDDVIL